MKKKNLMSRIVNPVNSITIEDLPSESVELSEVDLQHIVGGCDCPCDYKTWFKNQLLLPTPTINLPEPRWLFGGT